LLLFNPPGFGRLAYAMPLLLSFLFYHHHHLLPLFLTIARSKEISETTGPIFTKFSAMVDMLV